MFHDFSFLHQLTIYIWLDTADLSYPAWQTCCWLSLDKSVKLSQATLLQLSWLSLFFFCAIAPPQVCTVVLFLRLIDETKCETWHIRWMHVSHITEKYFTRLSRKSGADNYWKGKDTDKSWINHIQNQDKGRIVVDALKCLCDTMGIAAGSEFFCAIF